MKTITAFIFDLDGVIVDTARYHYLAWRRLAQSLGFDLTPEQNERLKGVSRMASLQIVLEIGGVTATDAEKEAYAARKNAWYNEYLAKMTADEVLPGAADFVRGSRELGLKTAIASASRNTPTILRAVGITPLFDAVIDGTMTAKAKPDPEVFLLAARAVGAAPEESVVFEDAAAGIEGAIAGGMRSVGIGKPEILSRADLVVPGFAGLSPERIRDLLREAR